MLRVHEPGQVEAACRDDDQMSPNGERTYLPVPSPRSEPSGRDRGSVSERAAERGGNKEVPIATLRYAGNKPVCSQGCQDLLRFFE